ncbi:SH3 domain-containing protein [Nesterenkonia sp. Act20]|uniref:SH3 domain-containing protein n=1 Tax=Nesterenkonia sp. Act20 TaxID=1483432 RepID=UPI001C48CE3E
MPKKLSSAVVGTLAVGLTMPLTANAAAAAPTDLAPLPATGVDTTAASAASLSTVDISATRNATQFRYPLAQRSFSYTSPYGARCMPVQGASTYHLGQDLGAANNSPIYSVADGTVVRTFSGTRYQAGYVVIQHRIDGKTFHSAYFHMWNANTHVRTGQTVKAGQTIARVGSSGPSTAPHLHLEIWEGAWLSGKSHNPTTWLAQRGINLRSAATSVMNISAPASCDYYTATSTPLRSSASSSSSVIMQLAAGTALTAVPGDISNSMVRVKTNGRTGWVAHSAVTPSRPSGSSAGTIPASSAPKGTSVTPTKYQTTTTLNARSGPGTNYAVLQGLPSGTEVTVTAKYGSWLKFSRNGQSVWSHGDFLKKVSGSSSGASTTTPATSSSSVAKASGTYKVQPGGRLNVRTDAGTSNSVAKTLAPGTTIKVNGKKGSWLRFSDGSRNLWVHKNYVNKVTASAPASSSSVAKASGTYKVQPGGRLNVRTDAGTSNSVAKTLAPGTTIKVNGKKGSWLRFSDGSRNLWVHQNYVNKVTASAPASSSGVTKASGSYKVQSGVNLNVRTEATTSSSKVTTLKPGTTIKVTGKKGSWLSYKDGSRTLWVHSGYLDKVSTSSTGSGSGSETVPGGTEYSQSASTTSNGTYKVRSGLQLNARTGAGTSHASVKMLKPGTTVKVTGEKEDWVSFKDGSRTLWVHSDYLTKASSSASTSPSKKSDSDSSSSSSKSSSSSTTAASGSFQVKSGISLNARTGASASSSSAKVLKAGTKISVTGKKGEWVSFKDGSRTLWVHSGYLVKASASGSSSSSSSSSDSSSSSSKSASSSTTAASGSFQVKSGISLNARTGASASSSSAKVLKAGTKVSVTGKKGEWVSLKDGSRTLWVHSGYLVKASASGSSSSSSSSSDSGSTSSKPAQSSTTKASGTYHVRSGVYLNARSGPGLSNRVVLNLNPKREIQVTGRSGDWMRFTYSGKDVWVTAEFLEKGPARDAAPSGSDGSTSAPAKKANSTNSSSKSVGTAYSTNAVNVRMGPSVNHSAMFSVRSGTKVELLEKKKDGWQEVRVNGATGWMSAQLLTSKAPSATGPANSGSSGSSGSTSGSGSSSSSNMHTKSKNGPYSAIWDKLAQCESGQNWKIDTGNGFYGGVQFSPESWEAVGGSGFPHEASRAEQIKRAYMLYKKQGWNAWPLCNAKLGLKGDPGGYGDDYYRVHPNAKTASTVTQADSWTATYSVPLRESAATSSDKLVQVPRGTELKQLKRDGSWLKVEYTSGGDTHTGWVNTSYISQA